MQEPEALMTILNEFSRLLKHTRECIRMKLLQWIIRCKLVASLPNVTIALHIILTISVSVVREVSLSWNWSKNYRALSMSRAIVSNLVILSIEHDKAGKLCQNQIPLRNSIKTISRKCLVARVSITFTRRLLHVRMSELKDWYYDIILYYIRLFKMASKYRWRIQHVFSVRLSRCLPGFLLFFL